MKLTWHIVRKDLVRLKWVLVLWIVVLAAAMGLTAIQARLDPENCYPFYLAANVMGTAFLPIIAFGLVMGLLHDDPVVEVDAFWITHPISGADLLIAKATALVLFALIPVVVSTPFWLSHGYNWVQVGLAAQQTIRSQLVIVGLALPIAVLSANASKFVMNVLVGGGGLFVLFFVLRLGKTVEGAPLSPTVVQSKAWIVAWLWFITAIGLTVFQFLKRRTRETVVLFGLAVVLELSVAKWWSAELTSVTHDNLRTADSRIWPGSEVFPARSKTKREQSVIVAEVPLKAGAVSSQKGATLYIQYALLDWTGEIQVTFSEAEPRLSEQFRDLLPGAIPRKAAREQYYILNRSDGRAFPVNPSKEAKELTVATMAFTHAGFTIRPTDAWLDTAPANLAAWLKSASLVKVVVPGDEARTRSIAKTAQRPLAPVRNQ